MSTQTKTRKRSAAPRKRTKRPFDPAARLWSVQQAAAWCGLPAKTITKLIKAAVIPAVAIGAEVEQTLPNGRQRKRVCYRYMVLAKPFIAWFDGLAAGDRLELRKTEAA